jgi:hypothetical protein
VALNAGVLQQLFDLVHVLADAGLRGEGYLTSLRRAEDDFVAVNDGFLCGGNSRLDVQPARVVVALGVVIRRDDVSRLVLELDRGLAQLLDCAELLLLCRHVRSGERECCAAQHPQAERLQCLSGHCPLLSAGPIEDEDRPVPYEAEDVPRTSSGFSDILAPKPPHRSLRMTRCPGFVSLAACLALAGCSTPSEKSTSSQATPAAVNGARIAAADSEPGQWMSHGRTYDEQRFSPLTRITKDNVKTLGLSWFVDLDTHRGQEATPLVVDGVMYVSTAWSKVKAYDAATGKKVWAFDPQVPGGWAVNACCDVVNRGVAVWEGKVFVGTIDGRLIALDAATGKPLWDVNTIDRTKPYTITGAPRVVKGHVLIGNGGAELGVRGYISAYDANTASSTGASTPCPAIQRTALRIRSSRRPHRRGAVSGGRWEVVELSGIRCPTIRSSISSTLASATALPGTTRIAVRARATTSSSLPSSRSIQTMAPTSGITRARLERPGTTRPRSRLFWRT